MKYVIDVANGTFRGPAMDPADMSAPSQPLPDVFAKLSDQMQFSSGLLPCNGSGLLMVQRGLGYEQMAYQYAPGVTKLKWGTYEASSDQQIYEVATPWRIIIIDYAHGQFVGIRAFYAAHPISAMDQQLYACNTPNINTRGYGSYKGYTSLGWICCYHNIPMAADSTLAERVEYGMYRYDGLGEPYNDANMSETDGTRVYQEMGYPEYTWNRRKWAEKTKNEGVDWCLDPSLMMPLYVLKEDETAVKGAVLVKYGDQEHTSVMAATKDHVPYTFSKATEGPYRAYYSDQMERKPFRWEDLNLMNVAGAFMKAATGETASIQPTPKPVKLSDLLAKTVQFPDHLKLFLKDGQVCPQCTNHYVNPDDIAGFCEVIVGYEITDEGDFHIIDEQFWCNECIENEVVWMDNYSSHVSCNLLLWCDSTASWEFACDAETCVFCESNFARNISGEHFIYNADFVCVGCTACQEPGSYEVAEDDRGLYVLDALIEIPIMTYTLPPGAQTPVPTPSTGWVCKNSAAKVCACGVLCTNFIPPVEVEGQEHKACLSCVNSLGEFVPVFKTTV